MIFFQYKVAENPTQNWFKLKQGIYNLKNPEVDVVSALFLRVNVVPPRTSCPLW